MRLPHWLSANLAMEMALLGDSISAEQACSWGLVNCLVEPSEALAAALKLAQAIDANAPLAVAASNQIVQSSRTWSDDQMFESQ